jgi:hypothetical protein
MHPPRVLFATTDNRDDPADYPRFLRTQEALIRSRFVLSAALRDPMIARLPWLKDRPDPVAWLQKSLEVTNSKDTEILQISMATGSGLSGTDQAAVINAVTKAYMDEVVNRDAQVRQKRHETLKGYAVKYTGILKEKRENVRKLAETVGSGQPISDREKDELHRLHYDLRTRRVQLRLERSEVETLLARRKKADGTTTEPARKEIAQLEDRHAVLTARQDALDAEMERLNREMHEATSRVLDLHEHQDEIAQMQKTADRIGAEVEALNVEIEAPPRIRLIDEAAASRP